MTLENFANIIKEEVENRLEENEKCIIRKVIKNNGLEHTGIYFIQEDVNISPTVYLDLFYQEYQQNSLSIEEAVTEILKIYGQQKLSKGIDLREFFNYENMKERIIFKLINYERNKKYLEEVPYIKYHDLAIVFLALVSDEKDITASIQINNAHLKLWNVSTEDLYREAIRNTPDLKKAEIKTMKTILTEMAARRKIEDNVLMSIIDDFIPMYVLSNRNDLYGAACILYPDLLKKFSKAIESDFFIIPSSINEVILMPVLDECGFYGLHEMIKEVNEKEIPFEEILSDSLYIYRRDVDRIELVSTNIM